MRKLAAALRSPLLGVAPFRLGIAVSLFNRPRRLRKETRGRRGKNLILVLQLELVGQTPGKRIPSRIGGAHRRSILLDSGSDHSAGKALLQSAVQRVRLGRESNTCSRTILQQKTAL